MKAKKKLLISMLAIVFVLVAVVATVAITFALTQQTIKTALNITYTVEDIDGKASATYTVGGVETPLRANKNGVDLGTELIFTAADTENAGNLLFPDEELNLTSSNDNVVIKYTYTNTGDKHFIATMNFDSELKYENMEVQYGIWDFANETIKYSEDRYALVVPSGKELSYWIKISIDNKAKGASFTGDFSWFLSGCDKTDLAYESLPELEFTGSAGAYSATVASGSTGTHIGELIFPSVVGTDPVTKIVATSNGAVRSQTLSVHIPDSVKTIADSAFYGWAKLQTVTGGEGIETIGAQAFTGCTNLTSITLEENVKTVGSLIFHRCTNLTNLTINSVAIDDLTTSFKIGIPSNCKVVFGDSVTKIPNALLNGTGIVEVVIGNNVKTIGEYAFSTSPNLKNVIISNSVETIGKCAFYNCTGLNSITIGTKVNSSEYRAFDGCTALNKVNILDVDQFASISFNNKVANPLSFAKNLYLNDVLLEDVVIDTATKISDYSFANADKIKTLSVGDSTTYIGYYAFENCTSLESVHLGSGLTQIQSYAFDKCTAINKTSVKDIDKYAQMSLAGLKSSPVYYSKNIYVNDVLVEDLVLNTATEIAIGAFTNAECIKTVTTKQVTKIRGNAFQDCKNLVSVTLNEGIEDIQAYAFENTALTEISLPSTLLLLRPYTFRGSKISTVIIPAATWYVGHDAFKTENITSISFEYTEGWVLVDQYDETEDVAVDVTSPTNNATEMNSFAERTDYYNLNKQPTE